MVTFVLFLQPLYVGLASYIIKQLELTNFMLDN